MPWGLNVEDALLRKMLWCVSVSREDQLMIGDTRHGEGAHPYLHAAVIFSLSFFFKTNLCFYHFLRQRNALWLCVWGGCNHLQQEPSEAVLQNKMKPPDLY